MIELIILALINSLIIIGINKATHYEEETTYLKTIIIDKMIFWKVRFWFLKNLGEFWAKPFVTCPTCMASVHSTYVYWLFMPFTIHSLILYVIYIPMLAGVTSIVNNYS